MNRLASLKDKAIVTLILATVILIRNTLLLTCPLSTYLGIPCPTCGMTRAWLSVLRLDIAGALAYHPLFWTIPLLYLCFLFDWRLFKQSWLNVLLYIVLGIAFGVCWLIRII